MIDWARFVRWPHWRGDDAHINDINILHEDSDMRRVIKTGLTKPAAPPEWAIASNNTLYSMIKRNDRWSQKSTAVDGPTVASVSGKVLQRREIVVPKSETLERLALEDLHKAASRA